MNKRLFPFSIFIIAGLIWTLNTPSQEEGITIKTALFAMDQSAMEELLQDGVTREELDTLEALSASESSLLTEPDEIELQQGENTVTISGEKASTLVSNAADKIFVFLFQVSNTTGVETIQRYNYGVNEKDEKVLERKGIWKVPASKSSRFFDYRHAPLLQVPKFVYTLTIETGSETKEFTILLEDRENSSE